MPNPAGSSSIFSIAERTLFVTKGFYRIEPGGAAGRPDSEEEADTNRYTHTRSCGPQWHRSGQSGKYEPCRPRDHPSERQSEDPAKHCEHDRFGQELNDDIAL